MSFDLHLTLPDHSPAAQAIQRVSVMAHISPEQAAAQLLDEAAKRHDEKTPAEELIGAFSSDEDSAVIDAAMKHVQELRQGDRLRDFDL